MGQGRRLIAVLVLTLAASCGGGGGGSSPRDSGVDPLTPANISGVWAGVWQGSDAALGAVSGTWEATITQSGSAAAGPSLLLGDIDCMDGNLQTTTGGGSTIVTGIVARAPCGSVNWMLTAANTPQRDTTGPRPKRPPGASGSLTGKRISKLNEPRIRSVYPPAGPANTLV